jgi:hypothetical protein
MMGAALAIAAMATCALAQTVTTPGEAQPGRVDVWIDLLATAWVWVSGHARGIVGSAYDRAPTLMIVLAALLIMPLTALVALGVHAGYEAAKTRQAKQAALQRLAALAGAQGNPDTPATSTARWPTDAWLSGDSGGRYVLPRGQALVRIGRHDDNDLKLADRSVHRHHALLHRTPEGLYVVTDLSGREGNGVLVNGARCADAKLSTGDTITLGNVVLKFETQPL